MANFNPADSGYVEVNERITKFYEKFPDGAIRTDIVSIDDTRVVVRAEVFSDAYNTDSPVGTGHSWLSIPGSTPYTRGSELENAETSAVGRAIANAGFEVHRSVASADEVRMHSGGAAAPAARGTGSGVAGVSVAERRRVLNAVAELVTDGDKDAAQAWIKGEAGIDSPKELTAEHVTAIEATLEKIGQEIITDED